METKKIEGFVAPGRAVKIEVGGDQIAMDFCVGEQRGAAVPATLVLGKAYTKEEVEAILREAISKTNDRGAVDVLTIINIAERNGLKP